LNKPDSEGNCMCNSRWSCSNNN